MIENMEWYRVFYFTAKYGNFSKAANALYITQPAVTHAMKQLEQKLDVKLFIRKSKGMQLTKEGEVLYQYIEQSYNLMVRGEQKIAEMNRLVSGEIRIGASDTLCKHFLLPHLDKFHRAYPEIKIQVTNRTSQGTIHLLKEGKIDFGIVNLPIEDKKLQIVKSIGLQDCFVVGNEYRQLAASPVSIQELVTKPMICLVKESNTRRYIDQYAEGLGVDIVPEFELGSVDLLIEFAISGLGIACVIKNFISEELEQKQLFEIPLKEPIPARNVGIVTANETPLSAAANQIMAMLLV